MNKALTVIIGAGPYGLSLAAHLSARKIRHRIFGRPMQFWSDLAAAGGARYLKSFCFGTNISTPMSGFTFADFSRPRGLECFEPCSIPDFAGYGLWFQQQQVDWLEKTDVSKIEKHRNEFVVTLQSGEIVEAAQVIVATGLTGFSNFPDEIAPLGPDIVQHTSSIRSYKDYQGLDVAVIGGGQSALEAAALLHEAGARPQLFIREKAVSWMKRSPANRNLWKRLRSPISDLGTSPKSWLLTKFPGALNLAPAKFKMHFLNSHLPPEGAWWLRARVEHLVPVFPESKLVGARRCGDRAVLTLRKDREPASEIFVDRVIAGTGYNIDVDRLKFLDPELCRAVTRIGGAPMLSAAFESSVKGLYFLGPASAMSFGPLFRFVAGTSHTSRTVTRQLTTLASA